MPRLIDRYIIRSAIPPFLFALLVFTFILLIPFVVDLAEKLIAKGVPYGTILRLLTTLLPQALSVTIPMALLVGVLVALGRFSGDREWVAVQACGVSIFRVARPIILLAAVGWAATSWVIIQALPDANQAYRDITFRITAQLTEAEIKPRVFFGAFPNQVLYVRDVQKDGSGWRDVFLADTKDVNNPVVYVAAGGSLVVDKEARTVTLVLRQCTQFTPKPAKPDLYDVFQTAELKLSLDPESVFPRSGPQKGDAEMTIAELQQKADDLEAHGESSQAPVMAMQRKFSIPVACLVFAITGVALGLTTRRDGKLAGFVVAIGVIVVYYWLLTTAQGATKGQLLSAGLAPWVPNIVMGSLGLVLLAARGARVRRWRRIVARLARLAVVMGRATAATTGWFGRMSAIGTRAVGLPGGGRSIRGWMPRGATILDGYLSRQYLRVFALTFSGLLAIFYISTFIEVSDKIFNHKATTQMVVEYLYWQTPQFVYYCIPLSVLIGGLVTIGLLTRSSELVVMRACGISLYRSAAPLVVFGVIASGALFTLEDRVLAFSNRRAEELNQLIRYGKGTTFNLANRQWVVGRNGDIYNYLFFDAERGELNSLSLFRFAQESWRLQNRTFFRLAAFAGNPSGPDGLATWLGKDGWSRDFDRQAGQRPFKPAPLAPLQLEPPQYFNAEQPEADRMNYGQLGSYIAQMRTSGFNVVPYEVALHRKISFPWAALIMTLIAIPFAVTTGRRGAMYGVGLGIALALVYWIASSVFAALGTSGVLTPVLAAWAANILFGAAAIYLLLTVRT